MERVVGIEPTWLAWKARTLPLSYTRDQLIIRADEMIARKKSKKYNYSHINNFHKQRNVSRSISDI